MSFNLWNFTIDDSSSYITYTPHGDGGLGNWTQTGWQPWYSGSGGFCSSGGNEALGQSLHITSLPGASLEFEFYGNAVSLYGTTNGSFDVTLDDDHTTDVTAESDILLFSRGGLTTDIHRVNLTTRLQASSGQQMSFDNAVITIPYTGGAGTPVPLVYENTNTSAFQYTGPWIQTEAVNVPSPTSTAPYHQTSSYGASASMHFEGEAVAVYGSREWGSWLYNISLDGVNSQYNGSTMWEIDNALLFFQAGLNPNETHTLDITAEGERFMLNYVTAFVPNNTNTNQSVTPTDSVTHIPSASVTPSAVGKSSSSSKVNTAVIVGPVVGGVAGLLIIGALLWWFLRRRDRHTTDELFPAPYLETSNATSSVQASSAFSSKAALYGPPPGSEATPASFVAFRAASSPRTTATHTGSHSMPGSSYIDPLTPSAADVSQSHTPSTPTTVAAPPASVEPAQQQVNVDRIIELIAQRIDGFSPGRARDMDPPPQYPVD